MGEYKDDDDGIVLVRHGSASEIGRPTYSSVQQDFEILLRLVSKYSVRLREVHETVHTCITRARNNLTLTTHFPTSAVRHPTEIFPGRIGHTHNARNTNRYKSRHEIRNNHRSNPGNTGHGGDKENFLNNIKALTCSLCRFRDHQENHCIRMTVWNKAPMEKTMRNEFCLSVKQKNHYRCDYATLNYPKPICTEFPRSKVTGMVLHQKLMVTEGSNTWSCTSCTILTERGEIHATYK